MNWKQDGSGAWRTREHATLTHLYTIVSRTEYLKSWCRTSAVLQQRTCYTPRQHEPREGGEVCNERAGCMNGCPNCPKGWMWNAETGGELAECSPLLGPVPRRSIPNGGLLQPGDRLSQQPRFPQQKSTPFAQNGFLSAPKQVYSLLHIRSDL